MISDSGFYLQNNSQNIIENIDKKVALLVYSSMLLKTKRATFLFNTPVNNTKFALVGHTDAILRKVLIIDDEEKLRTPLARIISLKDLKCCKQMTAKVCGKLDQSEVDVIL
nr:hypothetical protein [Candidatus Brachybacter algidus]